ncbi:hypothetical protein HDU81_001685 [Chytriomyces hyalinus]|nr:hypothetical protein HDU81_001685 [Chytriomyces hyalinus]
MANGCITVQHNGKTFGRTTIAGTDYCMQWPNHSKLCGSVRTNSGDPCGSWATCAFFPYCSSKHDMTRPIQTHPLVLRLDNLRAIVLYDVSQKTGQRDSYGGNQINLDKSEVDHVHELHLVCTILDELIASHRKKITPFVRDLANGISNLALTSHATNIDKFQAIHDCSEDRKAGNVHPAGLTHYLKLEFDNRRVERRRTIIANIKKEIVCTYDDQQKLYKLGLKHHDAFSSRLHEMLVDFKVLE